MWPIGNTRNLKIGNTRTQDGLLVRPGVHSLASIQGISKSHDRTSQNSFWHFTVVRRASVSNFASRLRYWQTSFCPSKQTAGQKLKTVHNRPPPPLSFPIYYSLITPSFDSTQSWQLTALFNQPTIKPTIHSGTHLNLDWYNYVGHWNMDVKVNVIFWRVRKIAKSIYRVTQKNGNSWKIQQKLKKSKKKNYWQKLNHYNLPFKRQ